MTRLLTLLLTGSLALMSGCNPSAELPGDKQASLIKSDPGPGYLTPERIHAEPSINGPQLRKPKISPDGKIVSVLQGRDDDARQQDLWAYDLETGKGRLLVSSTDLTGDDESLSEEEKNRRERAREYGSGIVSYDWVGDNLLLFPLGGDIYLYDLLEKSSRQITATKGFETDPKVSSNGRFVTYVRDNELFITDIETGLERQLSEGATDVIRNGIASFVVQEELGRDTGYWVNSDASYIAYSQIDESPVEIENRLEFGAEGVKNISQRYPFAGTDNASVKLGVVGRNGGATRWMDLGDNEDIYLTRVAWSRDGEVLYAGILSRDHKSHTILQLDPQTGQNDVLFEERSETWLNIRTKLRPQSDGSIIWVSEREGQRRVYSVSPTGEFSGVTPPGILVNDIACIDPAAGSVFYTGWDETPLHRQIFKTALDGSGTEQISAGSGRHSASFDEACGNYIGTFSDPQTPPQVRAFRADGSPLAWLNENRLDAGHPYGPYLDNHVVPEFGQIEAEDGTSLDYVLYKPLDLNPGETRPSVTLVYGGPGVQRIHKGWGRRSFATMLAHHGFVVFQIDGRGATNRGKDFEDILYRSMGRSEVIDQSAGAEWLKTRDFIDPDRMGVFGWSYGGYMTLHMLAQTDYYRSGVSGAPVTDWALYDTAYTERYLGDPNPGAVNYTEGAYEKGSVFPYLDGLTEEVLLMHGMADDNVVFRHSIKLMDALQDRQAKNLRVMTYPGEKHGFRRTSNKIHRDRMILEFFTETLGD